MPQLQRKLFSEQRNVTRSTLARATHMARFHYGIEKPRIQKFWATRSFIGSIPCTAHSFTCFAILTLLCLLFSPLHSFVRSLTISLTHSRLHGKKVFVHDMNASIQKCFNPLCHLSNSDSHQDSTTRKERKTKRKQRRFHVSTRWKLLPFPYIISRVFLFVYLLFLLLFQPGSFTAAPNIFFLSFSLMILCH